MLVKSKSLLLRSMDKDLEFKTVERCTGPKTGTLKICQVIFLRWSLDVEEKNEIIRHKEVFRE